MSTILKWAGNKTAVMPELIKHLPTGSRLVEPFAGSCAVMMNTDYAKYLIADINPDLINFYQQTAEKTDDLILWSAAWFHCGNTEKYFYDAREIFNTDKSLTPLERASIFLYLNRHCYRGLCRYNQRGEFNVPFGNYKKPYFPHAEILTFAEKAQRATFICASYEETLAKLQAGDIVYCDPPYDGVFSGYHTNGFTEGDQRHLASTLEILASEGYPVIASNSDTPRTHSLYRNFTRHSIAVKRSMGVAAGNSKTAAEIIAVRTPLAWFGFDLGCGDYGVSE